MATSHCFSIMDSDCRDYLLEISDNISGGLARNDGEIGEHTQIYEDKEGDWMLVGDVPWEYVLSATPGC